MAFLLKEISLNCILHLRTTFKSQLMLMFVFEWTNSFVQHMILVVLITDMFIIIIIINGKHTVRQNNKGKNLFYI